MSTNNPGLQLVNLPPYHTAFNVTSHQEAQPFLYMLRNAYWELYVHSNCFLPSAPDVGKQSTSHRQQIYPHGESLPLPTDDTGILMVFIIPTY